MRATSDTVMVVFSKVLLRKLLDHSYVEVSYQQLHWQQHFEEHPVVEDFMDMDKGKC